MYAYAFAGRSCLPAVRHRHTGFSLVELAMVLAIVALLIAGIMLFFENASSSSKQTDFMTEIVSIQQIVRSAYAGTPGYPGLDASIVVGSKQFPNKWVKGNGIVSPFATPITVYPGVSAGGADQFGIALTGLSQQTCVLLSITDMGAAGIDINETIGFGAINAYRPLTVQEANANCLPGNNNEIKIGEF